MISLLIPTYNYPISGLVKTLHEQANLTGVPFEILCLDDGSNQFLEENKQVNHLNNCKHFISTVNIGRTQARYFLSEKARYDWLLFIDSDVAPKSDSFVQRYIDEGWSSIDLVAGGIAYCTDSYKVANSLRWKFGIEREERSAAKRSLTPYKTVASANIMVRKECFQRSNFLGSNKMYGLDYYFSSRLKKEKARVKHIDNPIYHLGLEENDVFIDKTKKAIESLLFLLRNGHIVENDISLVKAFERLKKYRLLWAIDVLHKLFGKLIIRNLRSKSPSMKLFDFFRLHYFYSLQR